jgi:hypothetical protein
VELLVRGRLADGDRASAILGVTPRWSTPEILAHLHDWAPPTWNVGPSGLPAA